MSLARAGYTVAAGMRHTDGRNAAAVAELQQLSDSEDIVIAGLELDVQAQESVDTAINTVLDRYGRIDVIVHNAGHMVLGPAEAFTPEQLAAVYDVNVLGTQRVNRAALPTCGRRAPACWWGWKAPPLGAATRPSWPRRREGRHGRTRRELRR